MTKHNERFAHEGLCLRPEYRFEVFREEERRLGMGAHMNVTRGIPEAQAMVDYHFESAAHYWDEIYEAQDVSSVIYQERQRAVLGLIDSLKMRAGLRALEIGCGAGRLAVELAERGLLVDAIDGAEAMIETARARAKRAGVSDQLTVGRGDVHHLEAGDGTFDLVVAVGVLPWLPSLDAPLREMARVTKPGGSVLVTMDNRWALHRFLEPRVNPLVMPLKRGVSQVLARAGLVAVKTHARTWSMGETDRALERVGLRKKSGFTLGFGPFTVWKKTIVSDPRGIRIHQRLQKLSNAGWKGIRSMGGHYLLLAGKEAEHERQQIT